MRKPELKYILFYLFIIITIFRNEYIKVCYKIRLVKLDLVENLLHFISETCIKL